MLRDWHEEHGVQRRFRLQRAGAIGATSMVVQRSSCRQEEFRVWYSVGTASWPMALSGPPPLTAAEGAASSGVVQGPNVLTTSPAELLSFYPGVNTVALGCADKRLHAAADWPWVDCVRFRRPP